MTVIIVMELASMTVLIVMAKQPRDSHIHRRNGNSYLMSACVDSVYEGLRNDCAYALVMVTLRTTGLYSCCVHLFLQSCAQMEDYDGNNRRRTRVYDGNHRHGRQLHDGHNRHGSR